ncbi:MAG: hypothetical protein HY735_06720 [Verrucomicrobia bacterium]|nr:hypothetical protein [Verrucomicrobiota bacterium]
MADPETKTAYMARATAQSRTLFAVLISDFCHSPTVDDIDLSGYSERAGEKIQIRASDDFEVVQVEVKIKDAAGRLIEAGMAAQFAPDRGE